VDGQDARARGTDLSVIMREATSAYYVQHRSGGLPENGLFAVRSRPRLLSEREQPGRSRTGS